MFDRIINLDYEVQKARDGYYEKEREVIAEFNKHRTELNKAKREALKAFHESITCTCEEFTKPFYQVQRRIMGNYVLVFQKSCTKCGKKFSVTCGEGSEFNEKNPPDGYDGAEERYFNNNI